MKNLKVIFCMILALGLLSCEALAQTLNQPGRFGQTGPSTNRSVRALGMGNAFIALKGSASSPFYNPAGLNDLEKARFEFVGPTFEMSAGAIDLIGDVQDLVDAIDNATTDAEKVRALDAFVNDKYGSFESFRVASNLFSYLRKNFAVGVLIEERLDVAFRNPISPTFDVRNISDVMFFVSGAYGFWDGLLQVGGTLKPTVRTSVTEQIDVATAINEEVDDVFKKLLYPHFGIGFDLGVKSNLDIPVLRDIPIYKQLYTFLKPSIGLTYQDIANTRYTVGLRGDGAGQSGIEDTTKFQNAVDGEIENEQSVSVGIAVSPDLWIVQTNFAMDFRNLNQDGDFLSHFNIGGEATFFKMLSARAGFNQGYVTGGVGVDIGFIRFDFATYAEEVGIHSRQGSDRRYAFSFSGGF
jgi:hypothetical protein